MVFTLFSELYSKINVTPTNGQTYSKLTDSVKSINKQTSRAVILKFLSSSATMSVRQYVHLLYVGTICEWIYGSFGSFAFCTLSLVISFSFFLSHSINALCHAHFCMKNRDSQYNYRYFCVYIVQIYSFFYIQHLKVTSKVIFTPSL